MITVDQRAHQEPWNPEQPKGFNLGFKIRKIQATVL